MFYFCGSGSRVVYSLQNLKMRLKNWATAVLSSTVLLCSCEYVSTKERVVQQNDTLSVFQEADSISFAEVSLESTVLKPSEDTQKLSVRVDTIVDFKRNRRQIQDSLRIALDLFPKHIYLTFDDGPLIGSAAVDSIITSKNIKTSVFLVGKHVHMSKKLKKDFENYYNNPLIESYNHSFSHANNRYSLFYSNPATATADFEKNEESLSLKHKIIRLPGRNIWVFDDVRHVDLKSGSSTADMLYEKGYKIYGWDIEWRMNGYSGVPEQSVDEIYNRVKNYINNKSSLFPNNVVLLMHDDMFRHKKGQQLLVNLLDSLQQHKDYSFEHIRDYPFRYTE